VRLPVDIKARLDARAASEDVKPAEIIRRALVEYLDRHPA
jgi:predicted transcriptional regulator